MTDPINFRPALAEPVDAPATVAERPSVDELGLIYHDCCRGCEFMDQVGFEDAALVVLARWGRPAQPVPPAEGEVAELVNMLTCIAHRKRHGKPGDRDPSPFDIRQADRLTRAAELLERVPVPVPVPAGMIPVEYWDIDSGARIVSEPSEDGPGGCWVVLNSRLVNPFTEFPTAEAAWDALQAAHALPLPAPQGGEVEP